MRSSLRLIFLRSAGILLGLLGLVHLYATPHIAELVQRSTSLRAGRWLTPPILLNHVVVGILLLPLGYLLFYAAPHAAAGAAWAKVVVRATAVAIDRKSVV